MSDNLDKKEYVISKIKQIVKDEKFKIDAFFFCGFPGGTPNESLKKACEKYLEAEEKGEQNTAIIQELVAELEKAIVIVQSEKSGNVTNNAADMKEILDNKAYL